VLTSVFALVLSFLLASLVPTAEAAGMGGAGVFALILGLVLMFVVIFAFLGWYSRRTSS